MDSLDIVNSLVEIDEVEPIIGYRGSILSIISVKENQLSR